MGRRQWQGSGGGGGWRGWGVVGVVQLGFGLEFAVEDAEKGKHDFTH